jgi:hypothetical protein
MHMHSCCCRWKPRGCLELQAYRILALRKRLPVFELLSFL